MSQQIVLFITASSAAFEFSVPKYTKICPFTVPVYLKVVTSDKRATKQKKPLWF
jgi:hypothetical protein